ncbi:hypothetical protein AGMMS49593_10330 [Endomicrobiia bacterium]|nr:hypothetical protein AGMMS49593_10330 [Endomicrobiia bacterium]
MKRSLLVFCSFFALSIFAPAVAQADPVYLVLERTTDEDDPVGEDENAIHGRLTVIGEDYRCDTLERVGINPELDIPYLMKAGTHNIKLSDSGKFGPNSPEIEIAGRKWLRFHTGTKPEHSEGCLILGDYVGTPGRINSSEKHVAEIIKKIRRDDANGNGNTIEIRNARRAEANTHTTHTHYDDEDSGGLRVRPDGSWSVSCVIL